jgi:hypothetical protein
LLRASVEALRLCGMATRAMQLISKPDVRHKANGGA